MADTPEQRLQEMANAIAEVLSLLGLVLIQLPIPVRLPEVTRHIPFSEMLDGITRIRTLIDDEPLPEHIIAHLDQAILGVLISADLLHTAGEEEISWREDALYMSCTTAVLNLQLVQHLMREGDEK